MKYLVFLALISTIPLKSFCQQPTPAFGKADLSELKMTQCAFEPGAPALVLLDEEDITLEYFWNGVKLITERRVRIKIFKEQGFEFANVNIPYKISGTKVKIKDIWGIVYNLGENEQVITQKLERKQIYKTESDDLNKKISFALPGVKPGSVIEYKYTLIATNSIDIEPWILQGMIPVQSASCRVTIPHDIELISRIKSGLPVETSEKKRTIGLKGPHIIATFNAKDIPSFVLEPYMSSLADNINRVEFSMKSTKSFFAIIMTEEAKWRLMNQLLNHASFFGDQFNKPISQTESIIDSALKMRGTEEKINYVYHHVQKSVKWNGIQTFYAEDLDSCWKNKAGNSAEINLLILNLLRKAGVPCLPVLISTRDNGKVDKEIANITQFNGVDVWVQDSSAHYVLDGTTRHTSYKIPPYNVLFREAFVVDTLQGQWIYISDQRPLAKNVINVVAVFDSSGNLSGEAGIFLHNYAKEQDLESRGKEDKEVEEAQEKKKLSGLNITEFSEENVEDPSKPLYQKLKFNYQLTNHGGLYYFEPVFLSILRHNPFLADKRQTDIDLGCAQEYTFSLNIQLPKGVHFESFPQGVLLRNMDTTIAYRRYTAVEGNRANYRFTLEMSKHYFSKDEYPEIKDFYKKLFGYLNEQIVLRKEEN